MSRRQPIMRASIALAAASSTACKGLAGAVPTSASAVPGLNPTNAQQAQAAPKSLRRDKEGATASARNSPTSRKPGAENRAMEGFPIVGRRSGTFSMKPAGPPARENELAYRPERIRSLRQSASMVVDHKPASVAFLVDICCQCCELDSSAAVSALSLYGLNAHSNGGV